MRNSNKFQVISMGYHELKHQLREIMRTLEAAALGKCYRPVARISGRRNIRRSILPQRGGFDPGHDPWDWASRRCDISQESHCPQWARTRTGWVRFLTVPVPLGSGVLSKN